jgi:hypothetical protein
MQQDWSGRRGQEQSRRGRRHEPTAHPTTRTCVGAAVACAAALATDTARNAKTETLRMSIAFEWFGVIDRRQGEEERERGGGWWEFEDCGWTIATV